MVTNDVSNKKTDLLIDDDNTSWLSEVEIEENYTPSSQEEYMCDKHYKYFQLKLLKWRKQLIIESGNTLEALKNKNMQEPDDTDRASSESDTNIELRTRERYLKLISKIDSALRKIENKTYGYCDETGEEIGLKRLEARPIANLTVAAQEARERKEDLMSSDTDSAV
jgi:DnaK suppressor protein